MRNHKSTAITMIAILTVLGAYFAPAQATASPPALPTDAPPALAVPADLELVLSARGMGWQIYTCKAGADSAFSWTLKAPEAELRAHDGQLIGQHFAGPTWKLTDGSEVTGKAVAHVDSLDADSIPWLLVNVVSHAGTGQLEKVTTIQRLHTHGGKPPTAGCGESHKDAETKSSYTADYYFYAPKP
jgi:Protein of unknown function (DUF3455)